MNRYSNLINDNPYARVTSASIYGWFLYQEQVRQRFVRLIEHGGDIDGFVSSNRYYPDQKVILIILSNLETFNPHDISDIVEAAFFSH